MDDTRGSSLLDDIKEFAKRAESATASGRAYGTHDWLPGEFVLYESEACNFEVLDGGTWYKIDVEHIEPGLYEEAGVPSALLSRVDAALTSVYDEAYEDTGIDPTPHYLEALRREFDDARFINMTLIPGVVC